MAKERIDKLIAGNGTLSRKEVAKLVSKGEVRVNGEVIRSAAQKVDADIDRICVAGEEVKVQKYIYLMLNKPMGVVSASDSKTDKTVVDLIPEKFQRNGLFPAGRLDKDTTGFVLITDDGAFAHDILSPKHHVQKTYFVTLASPLLDADIATLEQGLELRDGTTFLPSKINILTDNTCEITICEGKYHQIKRMFKAVGNEVTALRRIQMGNLPLDENLKEGECRELTQSELQEIQKRG